MTLADLRRWDAGVLEDVATQLKRCAEELIGTGDEVAASARPTGWIGGSATEAQNNLHRLADQLEQQVAAVSAVRRAVEEAADDVAQLRRLVADADGLAARYGLVIRDDGAVATTDGQPADDPGQRQTMENLHAQVSLVLRRADQVDAQLAGVLGRAQRGEIGDGGATSVAGAAQYGETQGSLHDQLLSRYQVSVDPDGMVKWPTGVLGWLRGQMDMTASEARLLDDLGLFGAKDAYDIYKKALNSGENVFGGQGLTDGHSDAFRHAYWNAMLGNRFGVEWTEQYTTSHERVSTNAASAEAMDLHNNEVGRRIAAANPDADPDELARLVEAAVHNGEMVVVGQDGQLVRSNEVEMGQTGRATDPPGKGGMDPETTDGHWSGGYNYGGDGESYGTVDN
ncbi:DUF6973 domain-containing protein [Plantactinospora solaniradicis]|uniref:DUF6973 domain-containing protein n=1 Tax=Plantactinospora solaniradicis TaxID=1723736 RepID=A0ABW1K2J0_9ACTN